MIRKFFNTEGDGGTGGSPAPIDFSAGWQPAEPVTADPKAPETGGGGGGTGGEEPPAPPEGGKEPKPAGEGGETGKKPETGKPAATEPTPASVDWKEAIKKADRKEVLSTIGEKSELLKALGVDDFTMKILDHIEKGGDPAEFIKVNSVDYSKISDDDAIMAGIREDNPGAPESVIKKIFDKEMEKYETDPDVYDQETVEYGNYLKKGTADKYRNQLIEKQKNFAIPAAKAPEPAAPAVDPAEQAKIDEINLKISESETTKKLISDKKITIGGKDGYKFEIENPQDYVDYATGKKNLFSKFAKDDGSVDLDLFYATVAFIENREKYDSAAIGHGMTKANRTEIETPGPGERVDPVTGKVVLSDWQTLEAANKTY